ncbi:carcinoembryonic antigen-related cell adhesion molecule 5-like [Petaurus breviceps papuanus]|uniref:carcinoembryonic antigen-related cell adhesion molecule 5-like n=1 Tax=Petaurus breviceps papuanus TaxID=3040969 RepID=UPI0036D9E31A
MAAFLLSSQLQLTPAQLIITPIPSQPIEGENITLSVQGLMEDDLMSFNWFRGSSTELDEQILTFRVISGAQSPGQAHTGRETAGADGSLYISSARVDDSGTYTLRKLLLQSEGVSSKEYRIYVVVYENLTQPDVTASNSAPVENMDSVTLSCITPSNDASIQWYINKELFLGGNQAELSPDQRSLTVPMVTRAHGGPYQCEVKNPVITSISNPFLLDITYGPDAPTVTAMEPDSIFLGSQLTLSCFAASNPAAQYEWIFNGTAGPSGQQLSIAAASLDNSGLYTCKASNALSGLQSTADVEISVSGTMPQPTITANNTVPVENKDSISMTCVPPRSTIAIRWYKDGELLPGGSQWELSPDQQTLTLDNATRNATGLYQCETSNSVISSVSDPVTLNVDYGPDKPIINFMDSTFTVGSNLTLSCFADSNPPAEYMWVVDGVLESPGQYLFLPRISQNSSGLYTCNTSNSNTGRRSATNVNIQVYEMPDNLPTDFRISISAGGIAGIVFGILVGVVLTSLVGYFLGIMREQKPEFH